MTRRFVIRDKVRGAFDLRLEDELNAQQLAAVRAGSGPKLVIAGAGSGKTRTITYRVAHLIEQGVQPSRIMLATFTNKAAREMLRRVDALTGNRAGAVWGGTFHALANRILRLHAEVVGYQPNYSILDEQDSKDLIKVCVTDGNISTGGERFPSAAVIRNVISMASNTQQPLEEVLVAKYTHFAHWADDITDIAGHYATRKRHANCMDYDDLLEQWLLLWREHPEVLADYGKRFQHILVDEYQDTNRIQGEIVDLLAEANGWNLTVVGDDCQSIYAFRGAHYENILGFADRIANTEVFRLEDNYRSIPEVLHFTNDSIQHNTRQHHKELRANKPAGSLPVVVPLNDVYQEAAFICERALELRDEGIPLEEMAVLYRAHSHSMILQTELIKRNIAYDVRSGIRFFEQAHIKDVVAYLKILHNARDEAAWRRVLLMIPRVGNGLAGRLWERMTVSADPLAAAVADVSLGNVLPVKTRAAWQVFIDVCRQLLNMRDQTSPAEIVETILELGYAEHLESRYDNFPSRIEDIHQLSLFAKSYQEMTGLLSELVLLGEMYGQDVVMGPEGDQERLTLSSIHQAKGLEWHVVFVLRMAEGSFPSPMALRDVEGEEEERRVFYVATTRAQEELYLTYPLLELGGDAGSGTLLQPSRFIQEIDSSLYENGEVCPEFDEDEVFDEHKAYDEPVEIV